ncbi:MAG: YraN family protein [Solirubrobacteraceae bacterium]
MFAHHLILGKRGEEEAINFLIKKEYIIKETNWRNKKSKSEIDIIALKDNNLIIVEVKTRERNKVQNPEEAVNIKKTKLLIKLANIYIEENNVELEVRFDIISVLINDKKTEIKHIKNAFEPNF